MLDINDDNNAIKFNYQIDLVNSCGYKSKLLWRTTKRITIGTNPLSVPFPASQALAQLAKENGTIVCPKTNMTFQQPKIEKVFVM